MVNDFVLSNWSFYLVRGVIHKTCKRWKDSIRFTQLDFDARTYVLNSITGVGPEIGSGCFFCNEKFPQYIILQLNLLGVRIRED